MMNDCDLESEVKIDGEEFIWKNWSCKLADIISVKKGETDSFILFWAESKKDNILQLQRHEILCASSAQCIANVNLVNDILKAFERPKKLMVFINPNAGRKKATQWYYEYADPVFCTAGVQTDIIVTEGKLHASKKIQDIDLSTYQGVVSVGGDGTFKECVNGLLLRNMQDNQLNVADIDKPIVKPSIKISAMAGGTVNATTMIHHGTLDFQTAALHIVLGHETRSMDIGANYCDHDFLGYSSLLTTIGLSADYIYEAEKYRSFQFLGALRYMWYFLKNLFTRTTIDLEVTYKPKVAQVAIGTSNIYNDGIDQKEDAFEETICDTYVDLQLWCFKFYDNFEVECGGGHLYLAKDDTFYQIIRYYVATHDRKNENTVNCVTYVPVDEVHVRIIGGGKLSEDNKYIAVLDGETFYLSKPELSCRIHEGIISCFGKPVNGSRKDSKDLNTH